MEHLSYQIEIDAQAADVWQAMIDFGGGNWAPTIVTSELATGVGTGVGAVRLLGHVTGQDLEKHVRAWDDGRAITYEILRLPSSVASMINTWTLEPVGERTLVTLEQALELSATGVAAAAVRNLVAKELIVSLAGLKHHVESGESVGPAFLADGSSDMREPLVGLVCALGDSPIIT